MLRLLSITLLSIAAEHAHAQQRDREHQGPQTCGGHLKAPVGTITTPNFPNPFPVPIKCKWIIEHDIVNGTISIYFTQQYTTSGLTFTEYMYYDESYKLGERRALTVTDENITRIKWLQVQSPVLVVELNLNRLEGTQLRALGLLSVYGFNVTYEVRGAAQSPGPTSCSAIECRLLGHCYARRTYQEFYCSCFEGYSGADCGEGPLCPRTSNMCKNGGTCRQMGPAAVSCICAPGYTGDLCEAQLAPPECGIEECAEVCKEGTACDCNPKDTDFSSARFETRLEVVDQAGVNISQEIIKQLTSYLNASNITLEDEIEILNISAVSEGGARGVWVRVWGARREAGALRAALVRMRTQHVRLRTDTLHFYMQPALSLHTLVVNHRPEIWEGSEFILTCMAYGSPNIAFTWYKDGVKINFNGTTRDIWTRTVSEDALGRRMSVLGISEATRPDSGKWSCAADDAGRRRCRALRLTVLRPPDIRLVPSTITVNKGDNVSITCLAGAGRVHGALGFSWARERTLLPMAPGREVWEDLFPAGSVLKLYNVQKSSEFRCQVSSVAGTNAKGVTMWAVGADDVACESDASHGLRWPKTAPGAHATAACPPGHSGETKRFCEPKTGQHGVKWMLPDFSGCVADSLRDIYEQFTLISLGYSWQAVSHVLRQYGAVLRSLPTHPGEGEPPLTHAAHMLHYLMSAAAQPTDRYHSVEHLLYIYDHLLTHPDAFLDEEKIFDLQNAVVDTAGMRSDFNKRYLEFTVTTKPVHDDNAAHFELQPAPVGSEEWLVTSAGVELADRTGNASVVTVMYHDLGARLPSLRRYVEYNCSGNCSRSGRATEYTVASQQVQVSVSGAGVDPTLPHTVTLLFAHSKNYSAVATQLACGGRSRSAPRVWSTQACELRIPERTHVACRCRGLATIALFTVHRETFIGTENDLRGIVKITVSLGGAMCLVAALLQLLGLVAGSTTRLPVLLKAATAGFHSAAMLALLECDTRQDVACPGGVGWAVALCWMAGCAALCAAPLLLHAELAATATRAPSVGLLCGVCTLCWLTARLWGGAPLQLGAAANAVCAAGQALPAALALALALALRGRAAREHKPGRKEHVRERARVVRHTLVLLVTTCATQAAGVAYVQPAETSMPHVVVLAVTALANGIAMLVCYVIMDEECLQAARRLLTLSSHSEWQDTAEGDASHSLYIKQGREVDCSSSHVSPANTYWQAPTLESPNTMYRRQSSGACVADIVRCAEYKHKLQSPRTYTRALCDVIPTDGNGVHARTQSHVSRVCVELRVLPASHTPPHGTDTRTYRDSTDTPKESCTICSQSTPDVSARPIKSCLKKRAPQLSSSSSLPSIHRECGDEHNHSHIQQLNTHSHDTATHSTHTHTDKVLHKISHDLDFLLNRTPSRVADHCSQRIEEAPT